MAEELSLPFDSEQNDYDELPSVDLGTIHRRVSFNSGVGWVAPNVVDWRPGDIVIFRYSPNLGLRAYATDLLTSLARDFIARAQVQLGSSHSDCFHVAIYGGSGLVWESVMKHGVRIRHLKTILSENLLLSLRRLKNTHINEERLRYFLEENVGEIYGMSIRDGSSFIGPLFQRWKRNSPQPFPSEGLDAFEGPVVCSQFANRVLKLTMNRRQIFSEEPPLSSDFMECSEFETVDVHWHKVEPPRNVRLVPQDMPPL